MSGKRAKTIRKAAYADFSLRERKYSRDPTTGVIMADERRRVYQSLKRNWLHRQDSSSS